MYFTFAWRYFKAKKSANAINIIAWVTVSVIAFATCCQILVLSVFNGFEDLVKSLYGAFYTDLKITPAKGKTFILTPQQIEGIKKSNGVSGISLIAEEKALLQNNDNDENKQATITLKGVDDNYKNITGVADKTVMGKFETGNADNPKLVVGYGIQNNIAISVDDRFQPSELTIVLPKRGKVSAAHPEESLSEGNAIAAGVFAIQQEFDTRYVITNIDFVKQQMNFAANEYSAVEIKLNSDADAAMGKLALQKMLGAGYNIKNKYQQNQSLYSTMQLEKWFIYAVLTLILLVAAFNMISALTMLVLEKQKDITILQSMGATKKMVQKIFLSEGLLLAGIGAVSGIVLALIICFLQLKFHLVKIQGGSFLIDYFPVKLELADFILVAATVFVIAFMAAWLPARKASNQAIELR